MIINRRKGLMSISIAIMLLFFTIVAMMVITNISSNLYKNIIKMDVGKEQSYKRVVVMSMRNILEPNRTGLTLNASSTVNFVYDISAENMRSQAVENIHIDYPATVIYISTDDEKDFTEGDFFEIYTRQSTNTTGNAIDTYGIVLQFND